MLCPKCQHCNPDENRFCGQCGCDLSKVDRTIYPREGYDDADLPLVSDVEPQSSTSRRDSAPVANTEHAPRREAPPPAVVSREEVRERTPEPPREVPRPRSSGIIFDLEPRESERFVMADKHTEEAPPRRSEGIHGPSFLGLADSGEPDFLDDLDEPRSRARRNWLLVALAIVIVLGVVEWRNIRQAGMEFADAMKLNLPSKKGQQPTPAETATTDKHSENGPSNDGRPEILVNPVNSGTPSGKTQSQPAGSQAANNAYGPTGNAAAQQGTTPPAGEQQGADSARNNTRSSDRKNSDVKQQETAKDTTSADSATDAADNSGNENASASSKAKPPAKAPASRSARSKSPKVAPTESRGAEELARAYQAGSPETAAKWLWASTSKGNLDAPVRLADMYARGEGVPKDCEQATVLLRSSARRGNPRASARLGMYYATGQCVQQDRPQAWHWLSLAYQHDPASDWIRQYREHLWSRMTPDERARAGHGPTASASE